MTLAVVVLLVVNVVVAMLHLRFVTHTKAVLDDAAVVPAVNELGGVLDAMDKAAVVTASAAERLESLLRQLDTKVTLIATTSLGIAEHAESVADDLRQSHERADEVAGAAGEAADAASRSPEPEKTHEGS